MPMFTDADPKSGLAGAVGDTVLYVTGGNASLYVKYGTADGDWTPLADGATRSAEPVTADPRTAGLARRIGATCLYVAGGVGTLLYKYGSVDTNWCTWSALGSVYQPLDADLTALAASPATAGLVERTGAAAYTTRLLGVANSTDVPTRADADTRYASATGLAAGQHVVGVDATIAAGYGVSIPRYFEVSAGFTLELGADADLVVL